MAEISLDMQIKEVQRELALRRSVYPKLLATKRLTEGQADSAMQALTAVLATLQQLQAQGQGQLPLFGANASPWHRLFR